MIDRTYFNLWENAVCDRVKENNNLTNFSNNEILTNYVTYIRKCVFYSVTVVESEEIKKEISESPALSTVYEEIKRRLQNGEGVAPYLSKRAKLLKPDYLFLDWNILHLHMGNLQQGNEYSDRTERTLHIWIQSDEKKVYFIRLGHHFISGEKDPYVDKEELKIIYKNWPNLLNIRELNVESTTKVSDEERKKYRELGIMAPTTFKDYNGNKHVVVPAMYSLNKISVIDQEIVDRRIPNIINKIIDKVKQDITKPELISKGRFCYYHKEKDFCFGVIKDAKFDPYIFSFSSVDFWRAVFYQSPIVPLKISKDL